MFNLDNYEWYVSEVNSSLDNSLYYLRFLFDEAEDKEPVAELAIMINQIKEKLAANAQEVREKVEREKSEKDRKHEEFIKSIRKAYFEETGEHLVLDVKDMVNVLRQEHERIMKERRAYDAPKVEWENFITQPNTKKLWVKEMRSKLSDISEKRRTSNQNSERDSQ